MQNICQGQCFSNLALVNLNFDANLAAYPNPVKDTLTIVNPKGLTIPEVAAYNTSGVLPAKTAPSSTGNPDHQDDEVMSIFTTFKYV